MKKNDIEEYGESLIRLFPNEYHGTDFDNPAGARSVTLQVTDSCNLRCTYCYQINKHENYLSFDNAKKFIDMILEGDNEYCPIDSSIGMTLEFIGGEPFLAIDLIDQVTKYTIQKMWDMNHKWLCRFRISICSNGTLYFEPKVQEYLRRYHKFISFSISIDGNKELHDSCRVFPDGSGSYDKAMAAVRHYRTTYHEEVGTKMTLAPSNVMHTFEAVKSLIENDYHTIHLNCIFEEGWTKSDATTLYYQLKELADYMIDNKLYNNDAKGVFISRFADHNYKPMSENDNQNPCGGLGSMIAIDYAGNIFPCIRYMKSSLGDSVPEVIIGDLTTGIMKNDKYSALVEKMRSCDRRNQSTDECFYCPIASGCTWCSGYAYQYYKGFGRRTTFICDTHKAEALACAYYWNRYYLESGDEGYRENHCPKNWALEIIPEEEWNMIESLRDQAKDRYGHNETLMSAT